MPSVPSFPAARVEAERPPARREYESFDWYDTATLVLAATANFQEVITYGGRAERTIIQISAVPVFVRFRNRGESAGTSVRLGAVGTHTFHVSAEIVEVQDAAGAGGQTITATGFYPARSIERRASRRGPLASDVRPRDQAPPEQIEPR